MWRRFPPRLRRSPHPVREPVVLREPVVESPSHLAVSEDRERIAAELHDTVIQQLYSTGLTLQASVRMLHAPEACTRIEAAIGEIDEVIHHIRSTIFDLRATGPEALDDGRLVSVTGSDRPADR
jgi:signal transduction histidine kinase